VAEPRVVFYQLSRKVVNNQESIPEDARQVMYYSLAIGHHIGVMDCFSEMIVVPADAYRHWLERLPQGDGRLKLEGVLTWNEIEINRSHTDELISVLNAAMPGMNGPEIQWTETVLLCLNKIVAEPAYYLMVKMRE
jgi:hydrogenase-4 component J